MSLVNESLKDLQIIIHQYGLLDNVGFCSVLSNKVENSHSHQDERRKKKSSSVSFHGIRCTLNRLVFGLTCLTQDGWGKVMCLYRQGEMCCDTCSGKERA